MVCNYFIYSLVGSRTFWCGSGPHCAGHCKHRIKRWSVPRGIYYLCQILAIAKWI